MKKYGIEVIDFNSRLVHQFEIEAQALVEAAQRVAAMIQPQVSLRWSELGDENTSGLVGEYDGIRVWIKEKQNDPAN